MTVSKPILFGILLLGMMLGSGATLLLLRESKEPAATGGSPGAKSQRTKTGKKPGRGDLVVLTPQQAAERFSGWVRGGAGEFDQLHSVIAGAAAWSAEATMEEAMQIENPYKRREVLQRLFRFWVGSDQAAALAAIREVGNVALRRDLYRDTMRWLADDDPQAALKLLEGDWNLHDQDLWSRSVANWASRDLEAATAALLGIGHVGMREEVLNSVGRRLAGVNLENALEWVGSLEEGHQQIALAGVLSHVAESNPQDVAGHLEKIPAGRSRRELINRTADEWAERDPDAALEWAESLGEEERILAVGEIAETVLETDADRAEQIIDLIPDSPERREIIQRVARLRASVDIDEAMTWLNELPAEDRAGAWSGVAKEWARVDPQAAAEFGATAGDPVAQDQLVAAASHGWAQRDPAGAAEWARTLEGPMQANAMYRIMENWARRSPAEAGEFVTSSLEGDLQVNMTRQVVGRWLRENTNEASSWIDNLPRGNARDSAVSTLVSNIEKEFPETALQWAQTIGDERRREYAVRRINKRLGQQ